MRELLLLIINTQLSSLAEQKATLVRQITLSKGQNRQQLFQLLTDVTQ